MKIESIDDLLAKKPPNWDFWIGSSWNEDGSVIFTARFLLRTSNHPGHFSREIERESTTLRLAIAAALAEIEKSPTGS